MTDPRLILLSILLSGCASAPDGLSLAERQIADVVGEADLVCRRIEGGPVDAPTGATETLGLPEAIRLALRSDPRIQAALARVRAAQADSQQARLLPNPVLNVALRLPDSGGKPIVEAGLAADLIAILQQPRRVSAADHRLRASAAKALTTVLDVLSEVQEHYAALQALDAQLGIAEDRRKLLARLLELARSRARAGEASELEVTTLDAQRIELEVELADRQAARADERLILARLIGHPSAVTGWRVGAWRPPALPAAPEADWVSVALERRPEVQAGRWELAALGDEAALAMLYPLGSGDIGVIAERDDSWTIGPALSKPLPLFDWGQANRARVAAAQVEARHKLTQARRQVVEDVRRAYTAFAAAHAAVEKARTELVPIQERRRGQAEAAYRVGETDVTALLIAEQDLQQARSKLIELQHKTSTATVRLERAVGGPAVAAGGRRSGGPPAAKGPSAPPPDKL